MDIYEVRYSISSDFIETFNIGGFHIFVLLIKMIDQILVFEKNSGHWFYQNFEHWWILSSCFEKYLILDIRYIIVVHNAYTFM